MEPRSSLRILHLGDLASPHLRRIVTGMDERGVVQHVFTLSPCGEEWTDRPHISVERHSTGSVGSDVSKLRYLLAVPAVRKAIARFRPDVVHAHYATSYGLLGALGGKHPLITSVWGSDVNDFPRRSPFHARLLRFALNRADRVLATSASLATATQQFCQTPVHITPFGVDTSHFAPRTVPRPHTEPDVLVIGTIKRLAPIYGIDVLIRAFAVVRERCDRPLALLIGGEGPQRSELEPLAASLGLKRVVHFTGQISADQVAEHHNMIDVFANLSRQESYGVAVLEAAASGRPCVATRVGGLPEVVEDGVTGTLVPVDDVELAAKALLELVRNDGLRARMGYAARMRTMEQFELSRTMDLIARQYELVGR
jgi:L-malate glycosyltransferase